MAFSQGNFLSVTSNQQNNNHLGQQNRPAVNSHSQSTKNVNSATRPIQSSGSQAKFGSSMQLGSTKGLNYGITSASGEQFSVRSHLQDMENSLGDIITEIKYHRQQVGMIKSEKETLESVLSMKIDDAKKTVQNEEKRVRNDMIRNRDNQHTETGRLHYQIKNLQVESNTMQQKLLGLQRRIQEMEGHAGIHDDK
eukprot:403332799